ncbi:MAG: TraR/DksA C4-type zinc finger protein [Planctomycetaceae bacterium]|nr:TraR/DksA C4-type zinc finger protein [Planctomycetaceae bacterium]
MNESSPAVDPARWAGYRQQLQNILDTLRTDLQTITDEVQRASGGIGTGEITNVPMHLADRGTDEFIQEMNAALVENGEYIAQETLAAIERIQAGTYGVCENCHQVIDSERLESLPFVRLCVVCATKLESGIEVNVNHGRPMRPADTLASQGDLHESRRGSFQHAAHPTLDEPPRGPSDAHGAGTAGGGTAIGGLAGTNIGHGDPHVAALEDAMGSDQFDIADKRAQSPEARAGQSGGAVGGTPAGKRAQ